MRHVFNPKDDLSLRHGHGLYMRSNLESFGDRVCRLVLEFAVVTQV